MNLPADKGFWHQFIACQLANNLEQVTRDSIKDFHAPGFNYICFQFTPGLTIRLYIVEPETGFNTNAVNIHDHLYDSQMLCLAGGFTNVVFEESDRAPIFYRYLLTSALAPSNSTGAIQLEEAGKVGLKKVSQKFYGPGETHYQHEDEIHMVTTKPNALNVFMIWEHRNTGKARSTIFTRKPFGDTLPTPGAYNKYTQDEVRTLLDRVLQKT